MRAELDSLQLGRGGLDDLLAGEELRWDRMVSGLGGTRKRFGKSSERGAGRTELADAPGVEEVPIEAMIEKGAITIVCTSMGWVRAMKGHVELNRDLKYKDGDEQRFVCHAETTDKLVMCGGNGRFYTMLCSE